MVYQIEKKTWKKERKVVLSSYQSISLYANLYLFMYEFILVLSNYSIRNF